MERKKLNASACIFGSQFIYAIAGLTVQGVVNDIEKYYIEANEWVTIEVAGEWLPPRC